MSDFNEWWECEGSGLRCEWWEDVEEFAKRVAGIAWVNGAAAEREACKVDNAKLREALQRVQFIADTWDMSNATRTALRNIAIDALKETTK